MAMFLMCFVLEASVVTEIWLCLVLVVLRVLVGDGVGRPSPAPSEATNSRPHQAWADFSQSQAKTMEAKTN